jgi:hypothetical protein
MTDRQSFALANPVTDPDDVTSLMKFARTLTRGVRKFGTILTVDRKKAEFWWHVCVTPLDSALKPLLLSEIEPTDKVVTERLARELLDDVGRPDSDRNDYDEKSIHIFRWSTIEEERTAKGFRRPM